MKWLQFFTKVKIVFLFVIIHISVFIPVFLFHDFIPLSLNINNTHQPLPEPRLMGNPFRFLRALNKADAQFYISIAQQGYPHYSGSCPKLVMTEKREIGCLAYGFFPFYPVIVKTTNIVVHNVELSALLVSNFFFFLSYCSLFFTLRRYGFTQKMSIKTVVLLLSFPFAIFYRLYFSESLFFFLLIWFIYLLHEKKWLLSSVALGFLSITRPTGFILLPYYFGILVRNFHQKKIKQQIFIFSLVLTSLPVMSWLIFNYTQTGNMFFFLDIRSLWMPENFIPRFFTGFPVLKPVLHTITSLLVFYKLPFHQGYFSQLEVIMLLVSSWMLFKLKNYLSTQLWQISLLLFIFPLLTTPLNSFSRYLSIIFPLFIPLSSIKGKKFAVVCGLLLLFEQLAMLFFINGYWIG